ncbi:hypothetical protein CL633_04370 [bacterium]|nr:hypothetical protein [bacterium]
MLEHPQVSGSTWQVESGSVFMESDKSLLSKNLTSVYDLFIEADNQQGRLFEPPSETIRQTS